MVMLLFRTMMMMRRRRMMMMMILLLLKTRNPTLLRERSRTADQCKQTGRDNGPRLRRKCLISELSYGLLTSRVTPRRNMTESMLSHCSLLCSYSKSDLVFTRYTSRLEGRDRSVLVPQVGARILCFNCTNRVLYLRRPPNQTLSSRRRTNRQGRNNGVSDQCYLGNLVRLHQNHWLHAPLILCSWAAIELLETRECI